MESTLEMLICFCFRWEWLIHLIRILKILLGIWGKHWEFVLEVPDFGISKQPQILFPVQEEGISPSKAGAEMQLGVGVAFPGRLEQIGSVHLLSIPLFWACGWRLRPLSSKQLETLRKGRLAVLAWVWPFRSVRREHTGQDPAMWLAFLHH
jgi:hypothetical protein